VAPTPLEARRASVAVPGRFTDAYFGQLWTTINNKSQRLSDSACVVWVGPWNSRHRQPIVFGRDRRPWHAKQIAIDHERRPGFVPIFTTSCHVNRCMNPEHNRVLTYVPEDEFNW
jgi:hypothetical protein